MNPQKKDYYQTIRTLIQNGWTRNTLARNAEGKSVWNADKNKNLSSSAVSFCLLGAIVKANEIYQGSNASELYDLILSVDPKGIQHYNDAPGRTKEDIVMMIDRLQ